MFGYLKNGTDNKTLVINWNSPVQTNEIFVYIGTSVAIRDTIIGTYGDTINLKVSRRGDVYTLYQSGKSKTHTGTYTFESNLKSTIGCRFLITYDVFFNGLIANFKYTENEVLKVSIPNTAIGLDVTGNNNHASISATNLATFKTGKINAYPYHYNHGFSFNGTDVIPALLDGTADAQGNTIQYPIHSGIIDGLPNNYVIPVNADLNEIIPSGAKTWAELDALNSPQIVKTKSGSAITKMVVKKKMSNTGLSTYTRDTNYTRETTYTR
jgi:hypothetical protein